MSKETGLMPSPPPHIHRSDRKPEGRENIICQEGKDFHFQFVRAQVSDCVDDLLHACARHEQKLLLTLWCFVSHIPNFSVFFRKVNYSMKQKSYSGKFKLCNALHHTSYQLFCDGIPLTREWILKMHLKMKLLAFYWFRLWTKDRKWTLNVCMSFNVSEHLW